MGTDHHRPHTPRDIAMAHPHDDAAQAAGPGVRPGTRSRLLEARERLKNRG